MSDRAGRVRGPVRAPLEFLAGHHDRQLIVCAGLERLSLAPEGPGAAECGTMVLEYLRDELPLHIADEEENLFPLLRERCLDVDGVEAILSQLRAEHDADRDQEIFLLQPLERIAAGRAPEAVEIFARDAMAFAAMQRRHVAWENGTLLPLARLRLGDQDTRRLAALMNARRLGSDDTPR